MGARIQLKKKTGLMALFLWSLSGCSSSISEGVRESGFSLMPDTPYERFKTHTDLPGIWSGTVDSSPFPLGAMKNTAMAVGSTTITVYIEGDGRAWLTRSMPSSDPSPRSYMMVDRAMDDDNPAFYLARPCQYQKEFDRKACTTRMWTSDRFSKAVIDSYSSALDKLKHEYQNKTFKLVGYSGGAAVAMALAGERTDVSNIVTLAGNVDPNAWVIEHRLSALGDLVDPVSYSAILANIPQRHFVGRSDTVVPAHLVHAFTKKISANCSEVVELDATHGKGWDKLSNYALYESVSCACAVAR